MKSHTDCSLALLDEARRLLQPYAARERLAWLLAFMGTIVLGYGMFLVFAFQLAFAPLLAVLLAIIVQIGTISCFHAYYYVVYKGERLSGARLVLLFVSIAILLAAMVGFAFVRTWTYLEDMPGILRLVLSVLVSLVDPVVSGVLGSLTAAAGHAIAGPKDILDRAIRHQTSIASSKSTQKWSETIATVDIERQALLAEGVEESVRILAECTANGKDIARSRKRLREFEGRQRETVKHLEKWIELLRSYKPESPSVECEAAPTGEEFGRRSSDDVASVVETPE